MTDSKIPIAMHGTGRMAGAVVDALEDSSVFDIAMTVGPVAPGWGLPAQHYFTLDEIEEKPRLLIDFSLPDGTVSASEWCAVKGVPLLSGVTGLDEEATARIRAAASKIPVLWSPNLSLGINLMAELCRQAAGAVDESTPVAISDIHHQWKKDAPSGTAIMLAEAMQGRLRGEPDIRMSSVREGDEVGVHSVTFKLEGEEIELVHRARNRSIYAKGALAAGYWLLSQPPGLYSASDWLAGRITGDDR